ncbi:MAG: 50S ribosomal protein L18a [Candidatus Bathyarchaeota archaeon]|jgi:large subunit ribosomal protein LX|nr:MAG: 50S ribosomal protein L18a [Candidatus Bathyarchaeota archaeon]
MSRARVFRIVGEIAKPNLKTTFRKEIRATKPEDAKEKIYQEFGSKHRAKRFQIKIFEITEVPPEEVETSLIRKLTSDEKDVE